MECKESKANMFFTQFSFYTELCLKDILKAHEGAITQMLWLEKSEILITASKDKKMKAINYKV